MKGSEKMNLYELTAEYQHLQSILENNGGDVTRDEAIEILKAMEITEKDIDEKAENYARIVKNLEGSIEAIKAEKKRLSDKQAALENGIDRLKANLYEAMIKLDKKEIKSDLFKIKIQKNGGALPVIVDVPVEELEDEFVIVSEKPDLKAIEKYIKETGDITFAHFGERGESLRIK